MRATVALGLGLGFGLACGGIGGGPPEPEAPPVVPEPALAAPPPMVIGLLRPKGEACELVAAPFGSEEQQSVVAILPRACPADPIYRLAWGDDRLLIHTRSGLWQVRPASGEVEELPAPPDTVPDRVLGGVAVEQGALLACLDLDAATKEDGDPIVVSYKGKEWKTPKVEQAVEYTAARRWKLGSGRWTEVETRAMPLLEGQDLACTAAEGWPADRQSCPGCRVEPEWRDPTPNQVAALGAIAPGSWLVAHDSSGNPLAAALNTAAAGEDPALSLPLASPGATGTWAAVESGTGSVRVAVLETGVWTFRVGDQGWKLSHGGAIADLGVTLAPFVWPEGLPHEDTGEPPAGEEPAPRSPSPARPAPAREQPRAQPIPKQLPGEGKAGKGKAGKGKTGKGKAD